MKYSNDHWNIQKLFNETWWIGWEIAIWMQSKWNEVKLWCDWAGEVKWIGEMWRKTFEKKIVLMPFTWILIAERTCSYFACNSLSFAQINNYRSHYTFDAVDLETCFKTHFGQKVQFLSNAPLHRIAWNRFDVTIIFTFDITHLFRVI